LPIGNRIQVGREPFINRGGFGGRGCWNCGGFGGFGGGLGFGWWPGWGFGWPWVGFGYWDPFYWDSLSWGWPGYGYFGYPAGYPNGYGFNSYNDSSSYSSPDNNYTDTNANTDNNSDSSSVTAEPAEQSLPQGNDIANPSIPVLLYMRNGSVYSARDYWFTGNLFHYVLLNGREVVVGADQLDMKRTNEENAKSGVRFVVRSDPSGPPPPDDATRSPDQTSPANPKPVN